MMKKYLLVLLCAGLAAILLNGCSAVSPGDAAPTETASVTEPEAPEVESEPSDAEEGDDAASYYGTWEVRDYQSAAVSALSSEDMEAFRGTTITYQPDSIVLDGQEMVNGEIAYAVDAAYDDGSLSEAYRVNLGEWWNQISEVTHITVDSGESFFGDQFFVADADTIWIYYEGVFFIAGRCQG